ncbi:PH domain-containing protein [Jannaschia sp. R86511]|uniref:PH domain-containing protein n=1 Tax=Jannaschia sp. R86511 TaxID=3093853 RepID=UPI0036D26C18
MSAPEEVRAPRIPLQRLHPVSPLVRGWAALLVGLAIVVEGIVPGEGYGPDIGFLGGLGVQLGGVLAIAVLVVIGNVIAWFFTRYSVDDDAVHLNSGVLSRTQRQARLDRLQAVDVVQPLIGRLFGLAELRIEVAGGSDSQVRLRYLKEAEAQRLRNALLAAAAGVDYETEEAPEAPEREVLLVPPGRLVAGTALTGTVIALVVGAVVLLGGLTVAALLPGVPLRAVLAPMAGVGPGAVVVIVFTVANQFAKSFNFRLAESPDGLRVRAGLTETRSATVPPGRVQAVLVSQSWLWRRFDWWHVKVNIAGYAAADAQQSSSAVLLPVGTREDVRALLALVVSGSPGPDGSPRPAVADDVLDRALSGSGDEGGFVTVDRRARWLDLLAWRRTGYAVTDRVLLARTGLLNRSLVVVPHERTQSLGLAQGPLQRRLGVVTFRLHSTPGPVDPVVPHLSEVEGARLLREQGARARAARAASGPERWMRRERSAAGVGLGADQQPVGVLEGDRGPVEGGVGQERVEVDPVAGDAGAGLGGDAGGHEEPRLR